MTILEQLYRRNSDLEAKDCGMTAVFLLFAEDNTILVLGKKPLSLLTTAKTE